MPSINNCRAKGVNVHGFFKQSIGTIVEIESQYSNDWISQGVLGIEMLG